MSEQIARSPARVAELDQELVRQTEDRRPNREGDAEGNQHAKDRLTPARPGELYKMGMLSLLAAVQIAWLAAIAYGIFIVVH